MNFLTIVNGIKTFVKNVDFVDFANDAFRTRLIGSATSDESVVIPNGPGTLLLNNGAVRGYRPIVSVSASKTLGLSDANTSQLCSAASTITIPLNATVGFAIGTEIIIQRNTSAAVAIAVISGVAAVDEFGLAISLTAVSNATLIKKIATNTWLVTNPIPNNAFLPGSPTCQTQAAGTNNTTVANTAYVTNAVSAAPASSGLLVYATQTSGITGLGSGWTTIPFSTQPLFASSLFVGGTFTPTLTGLYRISVNLFFSMQTYAQHLIGVWSGSTLVAMMSRGPAASDGFAVKPAFVDVQLTAGVGYQIKAYTVDVGAISTATGYRNTLTINWLSVGAIPVAAAPVIAGSVVSPVGVTTVDWVIPAGVRRITLLSIGLSVPVAALVRLGTSAGIVATGYTNASGAVSSASGMYAVGTTGFTPPYVTASGAFCMTINRISPNGWVSQAQGAVDNTAVGVSSGNIQLSSELTTLRYISPATITAGSFQLLWEY